MTQVMARSWREVGAEEWAGVRLRVAETGGEPKLDPWRSPVSRPVHASHAPRTTEPHHHRSSGKPTAAGSPRQARPDHPSRPPRRNALGRVDGVAPAAREPDDRRPPSLWRACRCG